MDKVREDENSYLAEMAKTPGFKVVQKMAKELEESSLKRSMVMNSTVPVSPEERLINLGEISGVRKLLAQIVSRSESETKTPLWAENKEYLHGR